MTAQELIWHVDENDNPIGSIERDESRQIGARYRMTRVLLEDSDGNTLLQKRVATKKSYPGCWDTSVGGNVDYGESYKEAATRETNEEAGINGVDLEEVAYFYGEVVDPSGKKMNRFTKVYRAIIDRTTQLTPQPDEVELFQWMSPQEVETVVRSGNITDGLRQVAEHCYGLTVADHENHQS